MAAGLARSQEQLGGQPAPRAAQRMIGRLVVDPTGWFGLQVPLFLAPAACWCDRAVVESTLTSQVIRPAASARACNAVSSRCQVPSRCQRRNNAYAAAQDP